MKKNFTLLFILATTILFTGSFVAQNHEKCAAQKLHNEAKLNDTSIALKEAAFEWQMKNKGNTIPSKVVITIPVVFHIIHNGEAIGTGDNVSDALVMYQLQRINEDYRLQNADALSSGHPFFAAQADAEIEFCLATKDANGSQTTGIIRHNLGSTNGLTISQIDTQVKPTTIWDPSQYINFWCVNIVDPTAPGVDGYATFPTSATPTTDGVVVATNSFGYVDGTEKSITATHELGHYFNLIHIWGDDVCGDDMVSDTPPAEQSNSGCPSVPHNVAGPCSPGANGEMFMNYMDYSDAECVVMFSTGQKNRMLAAITAFRSSLLTSDGCESTVSLSEIDFANQFTVYPNPNNGEFTVNIENDLLNNSSARILNIMGKEVISLGQFTSGSQKMDLTNLTEGVYFIQFTNESNTATKKIVIKK